MNVSIKRRIYWSFFLLVSLFMANGIITIITLVNTQKLSDHIYEITDPSFRLMNDFSKMLIESKMYTTNWVFLRSSQSDKDALLKLHNASYYILKSKLKPLSRQWKRKSSVENLQSVYTRFEQLLSIEIRIINSLKRFEDYDNPVIKLEAESIVEDEVLPRTTALMNSLDDIIAHEQHEKEKEEANLKYSSLKLKILIVSLSLISVCIGLILSVYMTTVITKPINKIRQIVNDLGMGVMRKIDHHANKDEIGEMIRSVNNLSEKLQVTTQFAHEVGLRNFNVPFQPLSDADTLGKALITMRDNLKRGDEELLETTADLVQRNNELEQFAYIVSHNLRAPVANILGLSYLLKSVEKNNNVNQQEIFEGLSVSVKKLDDIILDLNHILQLRRQKDEPKEQVAFSCLVTAIKSEISELIDKENGIIQYDFSEVDHMYTMRSHLHNIFYHLIVNSIQYKQPGVSSVIEISAHRFGNKIEITFKDNGNGINLEKNGKDLFGLHKRFDTSVEGKGMGLFMVKTAVNILGGRIAVESKVNKGTEFKIEFPGEEKPLNETPDKWSK